MKKITIASLAVGFIGLGFWALADNGVKIADKFYSKDGIEHVRFVEEYTAQDGSTKSVGVVVKLSDGTEEYMSPVEFEKVEYLPDYEVVDPDDPGTDPSDPTDPTDPTDPEDPTDPTDPEDPEPEPEIPDVWPDAVKTTIGRTAGNEVKLAVAFETNDTNPLNAKRYMLKGQQKALWDCVIFFSGNLDYDNPTRPSFFYPEEDQKRPYFYANEGIKYILEHKNEIILPLKLMGTKVIMGILPNHDGAGLLNLNEEGIESFVDDLSRLHEEYYIDGFFWDEEYADYKSGSRPGLTDYNVNDKTHFVSLLKKVKEVMPDAMNLIFAYGGILSMYSTDEQHFDELVDGIFPNYTMANPALFSQNWKGTDKTAHGYGSIEATNGNSSWATNYLLTNGYCWQLIFGPGRSGYESAMDNACQGLAETYYGDTLDEEYCPGAGADWIEKKW